MNGQRLTLAGVEKSSAHKATEWLWKHAGKDSFPVRQERSRDGKRTGIPHERAGAPITLSLAVPQADEPFRTSSLLSFRTRP